MSRRSSSLRRAETRLQELEAESLHEALPEGFNTSQESIKETPRKQVKPASPVSTLLNIANGAIWGVLARKGLMALTTYEGSFLGGVIWANFAACVVMGMFVASEKVWSALTAAGFAGKGVVPVYVGVTTGFCGTCSSFSTFILEVFNKAADTLPRSYEYPTAGYGVMEALSVVIAHVSVSVSGFHMGKHLMGAVDEKLPVLTPGGFQKLNLVSCCVGIAAYIVDIVLICTQDYGTWCSWLFSVLFAPWGAFLRYYLSKYLNSKVKDFPLGTFTANMVGCLLLAVFTLIARGRSLDNRSVQIVTNVVGCHVLMGLDDGFCGALTTVSTFVVELFGLSTLHSYIYGTASVLAGFCIMVLLLGSYNWAVGLLPAVCH
ncbi:hypothetical protein FT663_04421 [Candidozyma haemuli var. vulneris]|uniref:Fluoride export protein 1 n=1 Tax=Candidozyma haemuli TaxID=45357 RepID=A0A2V1AM70_9ASCO|nr:hypothetical protein CXQ85_001470 [[Candida] haemuloni]KAF3987500.1 hypothetical protein FT663_04421 [[Candida] haemuloni var. vulneris]KAF3989757.1 hypothetical protein FT662_02632 [[Candida] haemuloni var. vulneris]PVH19170.1 hypothetical protein CXQ85_001470 [[Candida] haemuloni]